MKALPKILTATALCTCALAAMAAGCHKPWYQSPTTAPLGAQSDAMWQRQEANAEASDFVVYQHEFASNALRLNTGGEDHLKAIALRLRAGADFPVIVERSMTTSRADTEFKYPIHPNPELDMQRRDIVVRALAAMGVGDADQRVVVAPPLAAGYMATEATKAYYRGLNETGNFGAGYGGFGGAWFGGSMGSGVGIF